MFTQILNKKSNRIITGVFIFAIIVSGLIFTITGTLANPNEEEIILHQPNSYITIEKNQTRIIDASGIYDYTVSNTAKASAAFINNNLEVQVTGKEAGVVTISTGSAFGYAIGFTYQITDSNNVGSYTISDGGEVSLSGPGKTKSVPVNVTSGSADTISWESLQPSVATINNSGTITAVSKGAAIIIGKFTDKWGIDRTIHILVLVGLNVNEVNLNELIDLINQGESILAQTPNPYTPESLQALQDAVNKGKDVLNSNDPNDYEILDAINDLKDAIANLENILGEGVIEGDDGNYYKPVAYPPNVYEVVDQNGNSKNPREFVYNPGRPGDGNDRPAYPYGFTYYVEDPANSNIWRPVDNTGNLTDDGAYWGGVTQRPGGPGSELVYKFGGLWWVDMGQNVFRQVTNRLLLGLPTGGGPDRNPATTPGTPVVLIDNKYYIEAGEDNDGNEIYYGDPVSGGNNLLDSVGSGLRGDDVLYYKDENGNLTTTKPDNGIIHGDDDNYYKPVGDPPNVYEVVDQNGNSKNPREYVYNTGRPGSGNRPAYVKNGKYYVEDPANSNIWRPVDGSGNLTDTDAIWGGPDGKPGGTDDLPVFKFGNKWWAYMGQNVYKEVTGRLSLGDPTGGGPNRDPVATPGTPVALINGKYYIDAGKDGDGNDTYYGDPVNGGNNMLDSVGSGLRGDDVLYYLVGGNLTTTKPVNPPVVNGITVSTASYGSASAGGTINISLVYSTSARNIILNSAVTGERLSNPATTWARTGSNWGSASSEANDYMITIPANVSGTATITATAKDDSGKKVTINVTVAEKTAASDVENTNVGNTVRIDGKDWIVLNKKDGYALLFASGAQFDSGMWNSNGGSAIANGGTTQQNYMDARYTECPEMQKIAYKPDLHPFDNCHEPCTGYAWCADAGSSYTPTKASDTNGKNIFFALSDSETRAYVNTFKKYKTQAQAFWTRSHFITPTLWEKASFYDPFTETTQPAVTNETFYYSPAVWVKYQ